MNRTLNLPVGAGIVACFGSALQALALPELTQRAIGAVMQGGLLRLDAVQGHRLGAIMAASDGPTAFSNGQQIDADGWYGIIPLLGAAVGPFERKSQAMNGLALALMGVHVHGTREIELQRRQAAELAGEDARLAEAVERFRADCKGCGLEPPAFGQVLTNLVLQGLVENTPEGRDRLRAVLAAMEAKSAGEGTTGSPEAAEAPTDALGDLVDVLAEAIGGDVVGRGHGFVLVRG